MVNRHSSHDQTFQAVANNNYLLLVSEKSFGVKLAKTVVARYADCA
jgi:hypothetical protein